MKTYTVASFLMATVAGVDHWSEGDWAACSLCAGLIDTDNWSGLAARTIYTWRQTTGRNLSMVAQNEMFEYIRELHRKFRQALGQIQ